jgi:cytochrome P450
MHNLSETHDADVVAFEFVSQTAPMIYLSHPEHILEATTSVENAGQWQKHPIWHCWQEMLCPVPTLSGLTGLEGRVWLERRRMMQPLFQPRHIATVIERVTPQIVAALDGLPRDGQPVDIGPLVGDLVVDMVVQLLLGTTLDVSTRRRVLDAIEVAMVAANRGLGAFFEGRQPDPADVAAGKTATWLLGDLARERIAAYHELPANERPVDLVSTLMHLDAGDLSTDADVETRVQVIAGEMAFTWVAAVETTHQLLKWTVERLAWNAPVLARLVAVVSTKFGSRRPDFAELAQVPALEWTLHEVLRQRSPLPVLWRSATVNFEFGGYRIPRHATIIVNGLWAQLSPRFWQAPEAFDPWRFAPERAGSITRGAFTPFGSGRRRCIGENLALAEALMVLGTLCWWLDREGLSLQPGEPTPVRPTLLFTVQPVSSAGVGSVPVRLVPSA